MYPEYLLVRTPRRARQAGEMDRRRSELSRPTTTAAPCERWPSSAFDEDGMITALQVETWSDSAPIRHRSARHPDDGRRPKSWRRLPHPRRPQPRPWRVDQHRAGRRLSRRRPARSAYYHGAADRGGRRSSASPPMKSAAATCSPRRTALPLRHRA